MICAGIDPGLGGALCVLETTDGHPVIRVLAATPTTWTRINKQRRRQYDIPAMWEMVHRLNVALVLLEKQAPRKRDGKVATFSTGYGYGIWRAVLVAAGVAHRIVTPQDWRRQLGVPKLPGKAGKHAIREIVSQRLPGALVLLAEADAVALALVALELATRPAPLAVTEGAA